MENETANQGNAQTDAIKPAPSTETQSQGPASPGANGAEVQTTEKAQESTPFDKHPRWKQLQQERKREREQFQQLQRQYQEQQGYLQALRNNGQPQGQQLPPDQKAQLDQLVELLSPVLREKLGLSKFETLEKQIGELSTSWQSSQAEGEMDKILSEAKSLGLDPEDVRSEIEGAIAEHPLYGESGYRPGSIRAIYRDLMWDRRGELAERAVNQKTIQTREALKRGQTQGTSSQGIGKGGAKSQDERFQQMIRDGGGLDLTR